MRRVGPALAGVLCLSQLGAACTAGPQVHHEFGYVDVGGRPAVYVPLCGDDEVRAVRVYAAPDPAKGGDFVLLWQVEGPTGDTRGGGLVVLGDDSRFTTVRQQPPETFPRRLSVEVDTARGRIAAENREHAADLPRYDTVTAPSEMAFDTAHGRRKLDDLRRTLTDQPHACP